MKFYAPIKISENIHVTPEGYLLCVGVAIARTGDMEYGPGETPLDVGKSGKILISRDEKEVFRPETIASFEGKPVTIGHPDDFVMPDNWGDLSKGIIQNVRRGEGDQLEDLIADLMITDALAIGLVKNGLREVSCGYEAEYNQTDEGRGTQTNIIGNHLALVKQGRAGAEYAINDSKNGKGVPVMKKKLGEKIKALFARVADEAEKMADEEGKEDPKKVDDATAMYDELVQVCNSLAEKISALKPKDAAPPEGEKKPDEKVPDAEVAPSVEDRLKAIELALSQLMNKESAEGNAGDEGEEEVEVDDADEEEENEMTGDTASRAEILAPGIKVTKDVKVQALKQALATKDGKEVIDSLTSGKPTFDSADKVDTLFIAASELLKVKRAEALAATKKGDRKAIMKANDEFISNIGVREGAMTPEKLNEINAKHFEQKK